MTLAKDKSRFQVESHSIDAENVAPNFFAIFNLKMSSACRNKLGMKEMSRDVNYL